jgi:hypothetical protein
MVAKPPPGYYGSKQIDTRLPACLPACSTDQGFIKIETCLPACLLD